MRKREVVSVRWEVRWDHGGVLRGISRDEALDMVRESATPCRAVRITRYRLAPLVEVSGWRKVAGGACGDISAGACVPGESHAWDAWGEGVTISGDGGRREAEAALALLGFRVAK